MKKPLLQCAVLTALLVVSFYALVGGYAAFVAALGPFEGSGRFTWFMLVQWGFEAIYFCLIGYFLPRILQTTAGVAWAAALGILYAFARLLNSTTTWYGEPYLLDYLSEYGQYVVPIIACVAGAFYAPGARRSAAHAA